MSECYDRNGEPMAFETYIKKFSDWGYKMIARDEIQGKTVSTVWLGLDHQYGDGPRLIFETMVFPEGSYTEERCERYSTEAEALEGHARVVREVTP